MVSPRARGLSSSYRSISVSLAAISLTLLAGALLEACSFDWDAYDPRMGSAPMGSSSGSGAGGMMGASSSSSVSMGGGGMGETSSSSSGAMGGGGAGGAGGAGGMGGAPGPCGGMYLLGEDFEQPLDDVWKWDTYAGPGTSVTQVNGQVVLKFPTNSVTSNYASLIGGRMHDLRDSEMTVEVLAVPNPATTAQSSLIAYIDDNNNARFQYEQGNVYFASTKNGTNSIKGQVAFDPLIHRFWRMREQTGVFYWETSADKITWTIRSQTPTTTLPPIDTTYYLLDIFVSGAQMNLGEARYDNINGGTPTGNYCPISKLQDNFDDGIADRAWGRANADNGCSHVEMGGELIVMPATTTSTYCGYISATAYDLTSNAATVEVTKTPDTMADTATYLVLKGEKGKLEIVQEGSDLFMRQVMPGMTVDLAATKYDPLLHRWWRIREKNGTTYWETSANGTTWTIAAQKMNPIPVKAVDVQLIAGTGSAVLNPGEAHFDNFNLGP